MQAKKIVLKGAKVFDGQFFIGVKNILLSNNLIEDVSESDFIGDFTTIDCTGLILSPAFVDLQLNGCGGVLFNDEISAKTLNIMHQTNIKFATTSFLPTLITTSENNIKKAIAVVTEYRKEHPNRVLGLHIEGPYISKIKRGIHQQEYIKPIKQGMVNYLIEASKTLPIKITLAPEVNDAKYIKLLSEHMKVSVGHSSASYAETINAFNSGASLVTHLFNAMSPFESRKPGVVGATFDTDIYAGIIADGHHVDFASVRIAKKIKQNKLFLVTDAVTPMGTNISTFMFAGQKIYVKNGMCVSENGTLGGSNIDMLSSVQNITKHVGISTAEALRMATSYPILAFNSKLKLGSIAQKFIANVVLLKQDLSLAFTINEGSIVYRN